jgi:hypothetical protein
MQFALEAKGPSLHNVAMINPGFQNRALRAAAIAVLWLLPSCTTSHFEPPQRLGPPALVMHENEPRLWLFVKREEQKQISTGWGRRSSGSIIRETRYHFDLQCHDARTTERIWKTRLLTLKDKEGGHGAQARIFGQDGDVVWLFLNDQPVAVSSRDGSVLADRNLIEQRNAALQGLVPKELNFYAFDNGLVITAADARRYKVLASDYSAKSYQPVSEEQFSRLQFMSTTWNGGYRTGDFLTRMATLGGRWLGLYTEKEAADAGNDSFGDRLKDPTRVLDEGARARRSFWTARIGKTKEFTEGSHDRLFDVTRISGALDFLEAGFLVRQGTKQPLELHDPPGLLVLHRTRLDAEGRLALTRVDETLREKWSAPLPILELGNRFEFPDRLLMFGAVQLTTKGVTQWQEFIVALDLPDGRTQAWNVTLDRSVPSAELKKSAGPK